MKLWIVTKHEILQKEQNEVCPEEIGQKALGLCRVPYAWTLPFFVITKDLFKNILDRPQDSELIINSNFPHQKWDSNIEKSIL